MHLRTAAGACVLSAGLVIGSSGGAIAVADTESGASTGSGQAADGSSGTASPARGPIATIADSLRKAVQHSVQSTVQGVTGTLNSIQKPGQLPSYIPASPKTTFGGTPTVHGSTGPSSPTPEDVSPPAPESSPASDSPAVSSPTTSPSASVAPNPIGPASNAVAPVAKAFTAVVSTVVSTPGVLVSLPTSATPLSDVLTYFQNVVTSIGDAGTSLSQLPTDLAGLLGVGITAPAATIGAATGVAGLHVATAAPITAPGWSALPQLVSLPEIEGGPPTSTLPAPATPLDITTTDVPRGESGTGSALIVPKSDGTNDVLSTVEHIIGAFVATVSLTALAAVALPGLIGLLTTCAAGIRVGYRQARAGSELPNTVISRFVGSGPIGVVRSGAQVELRVRAPRVVRTGSRDEVPTRTLRVVRSESSSTAHLLDQAV